MCVSERECVCQRDRESVRRGSERPPHGPSCRGCCQQVRELPAEEPLGVPTEDPDSGGDRLVCVRESVCVSDRVRVRKRVCVCQRECVCVRERVCVCVRETERKCVCQRETLCVCARESVWVCVCQRPCGGTSSRRRASWCGARSTRSGWAGRM